MKEIKEFNDFDDSDGYVIVDGITDKTPGGKKLLSEIIPSVPVTDVKIGNTTIVSNGVATIPENKTVPSVTPTTDQGKVLTVNDSDQIVWETPAIQISQSNGDVSVINAINDTSSGGYVFDVNKDDSLDTVVVSNDDGKKVRKLKVTNPVPSTDDVAAGNVLTYNGSTIGWAPVQGGGGGGNPFSLDEMLTWTNTTGTSLAKWLNDNPESNHVDGGNLQTSIKSDKAVVKYQYILYAGTGSFFAPWAS